MSSFDEQEHFRDEFTQAFAQFKPHLKTLYQQEKTSPVSAEVWQLMAKHGWFGCLVPSKYGGNERGVLAMAMAAEAISRSGIAPLFAGLTALTSACISRFGSEDLKEQYLPRICRGEIKFAFGATEERAGFNMLEIDTFAEKVGDGYVINGSKTYTSGFDIADYVLLVARTITVQECQRRGLPKTAGISIFLVDTQSAGISRQPLNTRGEGYVKQFSLSIENLRVPAKQLVGKESEAAAALFTSFNIERILFIALVLGSIEYCLAVACEYASSRKVFGDAPIGKYQSIQHPLADAKIRADAVRNLLVQAASAIDHGGDPLRLTTLINSAKYLASEAGSKAVNAAIDALGGRGFNEDYGLIQLAEVMQLLRLSPISNHLILNDVAEKVLGLPRSY
jgi:alkylation response protein AidB-like acyl-CoA dehydrogenase